MEFTIRIKQNPQSGWLIGQCEEIPEAITQGKDMDELMFMMEDAIVLSLECRRDEFQATLIDLTFSLIVYHPFRRKVYHPFRRKVYHPFRQSVPLIPQSVPLVPAKCTTYFGESVPL